MKNFSFYWTGFITLIVILLFAVIMRLFIDPQSKQITLIHISILAIIIGIIFVVIGVVRDEV